MKYLFVSVISIFCLSMANASIIKNAQNQKNLLFSEYKEKKESSYMWLMTILPCTRTSTSTATATFAGCAPGTTVTVSTTVTCTKEGNSCDDAAFAALQCSYLSAWSWVYSQEPVCPPE